MPHPDQLVDITVDADIGAAPRDQFSTVALVGSAPTSEAPTDGFNNATRHTDAASVATAFGDGSDVHNAASEAFAEGVGAVWAIVLEATETTEVVGGESEATNTGTVSTVPISGTSPVAIQVDGTGTDVSAVTESPPSQPSAGEAVYNADTGEVSTGDSTSGSGTGIEVTYTTLSWTAALDELADVGADLVALAEQRIGRAGIGDMDELLTWADGNDVAVPVVYPNGQSYSDVTEGLDEAHDVGSYLTSKYGLPIASESGDNVAGRVVGRYAVEEPWYNIYLKTLPLSVAVPTRYARYVGAPDQPGTFEGGTTSGGGSDGGAGASNVLLDDGGTVLTNSLSLAGLESDYRYLDIARTEAYVKDRIRVAISDLFRDNDIRFNETGQTAIRAAIEQELNPITGDRNQPLREFTASVPAPEDIADSSRANRLWSGITVEITIAGYAHRADVTLVIEV